MKHIRKFNESNQDKIQTIINEAEYEILAFDRTSKVVSEKLINTLKKLALCNVRQSEQLKALEELKDFAYDNCQPHNQQRLAEIMERL